MEEPKGTKPYPIRQTCSSLDFALLRCYTPDSNLVFSLFSIQAALAFVATGAQGPTEEQFRHVLEIILGGDLDLFFSGAAFGIVGDGLAEGGPIIQFSNGVWVDESLSLNVAFIRNATPSYNADAKAGSFQTTADDVKCKVNARVRNATAGIIQELLPTGSVNHNARLILENSLYFMGVWEDKFVASQIEEEFWQSDGSSVRVPFLTSKGDIFLYKYRDFKVLELLYKKGKDQRQFTMSIFLPDNPDRLRKIPLSLRSNSSAYPYKMFRVGEFKLPKFKISFGFEASQAFKSIDWTLSYTGRGDLKGMVDSSEGDRHFLSSIHHGSVVEFSEEGTVAAAATAAIVEVDEGTEAATVTAAVVVEGTKVANATVAVAVEVAEEETETATVVSMEGDGEGTDAVAPTSDVSVADEVGTESATVTSADSWEDDEEGAASTSDVSVDDNEKGTESVTVTSSDSMEEDEEENNDIAIFKADRPFAFVIREETIGGVLFAGYLLNPLTTAACNI